MRRLNIAIEEVPAGRLQSGPPRGLGERLKEVPGVLTVRRGGSNLEPVVQGLREYQVAMVVDGSRAFAAGPARMDSEISHVDPARVSSLEVIKGPYALSECSGGLAAVLVKTDPVPVHDKTTFGGTVSTGYSLNGANRWGHTRFFAAGRRAGISVRASGGKGGDYRAGSQSGAGPTVPGRFAEYQLGGKLRLNLTSEPGTHPRLGPRHPTGTGLPRAAARRQPFHHSILERRLLPEGTRRLPFRALPSGST